MQKWIRFVLCFFMITFIVPQSIYGERQPAVTPLKSILNPSHSLRIDTFEWMEPCIDLCKERLIFEETDVFDPMDAIERGDFIRWLIQSIDIPLVSSDHNFADVDKDNPNYKYIQTAVESGIIEKTTHFYPTHYVLRYVASIWLVNATGEEAVQKARSYTEPVIPAQDGYYEVPQEAIGSMTVCYLPTYQLMNYRYTKNDWYRRIHPRHPLIFGEAAYSFTRIMKPLKKGGEVKIALTMKPRTLFPGIDFGTTMNDILNMVSTSTISGFDNYWSIFPELLKRIPTQENSLWTIQQDKNGDFQSMEVVYELRENIFWSDGTPITAEDALFAFYFYNHPSTPIIHSEVDFWVNKIVALDEHKVMVQWNTPYLYEDSGLALLPRHYFEEKFQYTLEPYDTTKPQDENSEKYKADSEFIKKCCEDEEYGSKPILAGPYYIEMNKKDHILLKPNPYYLFDAPLLDEIQINFYDSPFEIFQNSNDSIEDLIPLYYTDTPLPSTHRLQITQNDTWEHIDLNVDVEPLNDRNVRKALMLAIDRNRILEEVYQGNEVILSNSWLSPIHLGSQQYPLQKYSYNKKEAEKLLDKAGWIMDPVTKYREKDGEVFTITFITTAGNRSRASVQDIITECWEELGIEVIISNEQPMSFFTSTLRKRDFDGPSACLYAWIMGPYSTLYSIIHSSQIPTERNGWTGQNYTGFQNDYVDSLLNDVITTFDKTQWMKNLNIIQEILLKELPSLPLHNRTDISCLHKDLMNYKPCGNSSSSDFWNIAYWYWN
jgi:peptide/nickel transport system substrate-binding protein